jgi:hypothetical protein
MVYATDHNSWFTSVSGVGSGDGEAVVQLIMQAAPHWALPPLPGSTRPAMHPWYSYIKYLRNTHCAETLCASPNG